MENVDLNQHKKKIVFAMDSQLFNKEVQIHNESLRLWILLQKSIHNKSAEIDMLQILNMYSRSISMCSS